MKKIILSLIVSMFSIFMYSQSYNVVISGFVTNEVTGEGVPQQEMTVSTSDSLGGFSYFNTVFTDASGYYEDVMTVPDGETGMLEVSTIACNDMLRESDFFTPDNTQLVFDFQVCGDSTGSGCEAMFYYYPSQNDPYSFQFVDISEGEPDSWTWDFGDGASATDQNPEHTYTDQGQYVVTLTIENSVNQCSSIFEEIVMVGDSTWFGDCQAMFYTYPDSVDFHTINFVDMSIAGGNPSGIPDAWYWEFGDGTSSTDQNPTHTYADNGDYNVCLTISSGTSQDSCESTECQIVRVGDGSNGCEASYFYYPEGDTTNPNGGMGSLNIQFVDASYGEPTNWLWDFGDGETSNEQNPLHTFSEEGVYQVCLSISNYNNDTCESTYCEDVFVMNDTTFVECYTWYEYEIDGLSVDFQAFIENGGSNTNFTWDFGDGTTGEGESITHVFPEDGMYEVLLTASDNDSLGTGCTSVYSYLLWIGDTFSFNISGFVYLDDSMTADYANVYLLTFDTIGNGLINIATTQIDNQDGYYEFTDVSIENCVYFVQAELTDQSAYANDYVPTYHFSSLTWEEAMPIFPLWFNYGYDVQMISATSSNSGSGVIAGTVTKEGSRELLGNIEVLLLNEQGEPILSTRTDANGQFSFSNLADGIYTVYTEIVGIETIPFDITLSEQNNSTTVNVVVKNGQALLGIEDIPSAYIEAVDNISPNPVMANASLNITIKESSAIEVEVLNQYGQSLYITKVSLSNGKHKVSIPSATFAQGMYFVKITANDNVSTVRKFIKLR